jgi:hypothetical protein
MAYDGDLRTLLTEVRDQLKSVEKLLENIPEPCDGEREDGTMCSLAAGHKGWHLAEDGRTQWLDR